MNLEGELAEEELDRVFHSFHIQSAVYINTKKKKKVIFSFWHNEENLGHSGMDFSF